MAYSLVGILSFVIHIIVNIDVLFRKGGRDFPGGTQYLFFLLGVLLFHAADGCWGLFYDNKMANALFIDTSVYFIGMGVSILFWGLFVSKYIGEESRLIKPIAYIGFVVFALQMVALVVNIFTPVLFQVTKEAEYSAQPIRYVTLALQILMFTLIGIYSISAIIKRRGTTIRRHIAIASFSIAMIIFITLQVCFPLLPMYSLGYLFGVISLHSFVFEDQRMQRQRELEAAKTQIELDALTGMKSKHAYVDREEQIDKLINKGEMGLFAIVVFDLNDLKIVNDTYGHDAGDIYIVSATKLISQIYSSSEIYRIGGDEFVALLEGNDYQNRDSLLKTFNERIDMNIKKRGVVISSGMSAYEPGVDNTFIQVFNRADREMYQRKHEIKEGIRKN